MLHSTTPLPSTHSLPLLSSPSFLRTTTTVRTTTFSHLRANPQQWLTQIAEELSATTAPEDGPIELSPSTPSLFATTDDPTPLQISTSVLLTGAVSVFLLRSIRRRAKRAKELRLRSSGATNSLKDEALESLKAIGSISVGTKAKPSPVQAFLGGVTAAVIALILYKFTTTIEASLNRQTMPDNYSVRQITITIRTIINGLCYLATFVFGFNSLGLFLYSGQLAFNSLSEDLDEKDIKQPSPPLSPEDQSNAQDSSEKDQISDQR